MGKNKDKEIPRILGIVGSPRRGGNTETLIDEVLAGAKEAGAKTTKIILNELTISPCQGCNQCAKAGVCQLNDDMDKINEEMQRSSIFVFGTPVYFWGPTGQFKVFTDRLLATYRKGYIKGKKVILVIPLGGGEATARFTIGMLTTSINYFQANLAAQIIAPKTMEIEDLMRQKELLKQAREKGREAVKESS